MKTLYIINQRLQVSHSLLSLLQEDDALLLMENAVITVADNRWNWNMTAASIYLLQEDLCARGLLLRAQSLGNTRPGLKTIDYDGFVDLSLSCDRVVSWA